MVGEVLQWTRRRSARRRHGPNGGGGDAALRHTLMEERVHGVNSVAVEEAINDLPVLTP